jgi:hypothetical protein
MLTDPQTWLYYTSGLVLGAYVWDLLAGRSRWPRLTMLTAGLLLLESRISLQVNGPQHDGQTFLAVVRVVVLLGILAVVFWPGTRPAAQLPGNSGSDESVPDEAVAEEGATGAAPEQVPSV